MIKTNAKIGVCKIAGSLFVLQTKKTQDFAIVTKVIKDIYQKPTWVLLYRQLGHLDVEAIKKLSKITTGLKI